MTATFEDFQKFSKDQIEAFTAASSTLDQGPAGHRHRVRAIIRRRPSPREPRLYEKLLGARSVESAVQIQTEFAKQAYEGFVAQATRVSELYTRVASDALKPVTAAYANIQK